MIKKNNRFTSEATVFAQELRKERQADRQLDRQTNSDDSPWEEPVADMELLHLRHLLPTHTEKVEKG